MTAEQRKKPATLWTRRVKLVAAVVALLFVLSIIFGNNELKSLKVLFFLQTPDAPMSLILLVTMGIGAVLGAYGVHLWRKP